MAPGTAGALVNRRTDPGLFRQLSPRQSDRSRTHMKFVSLLAESDTQVIYQFGRLQSLTEWWQWFLLAVTCGLMLGFVFMMYRKDCVELPKGVAWGLTVLR